jgi:hypothetical protein
MGLVALVAAGSLVTDFSLAAPLAQKSSRTARAKGSQSALPNVTYTGFRLLKDGRAVVYVELTSKVPVTVHKQKNQVIYELEGAQVALKNNRNPLITRQFATILESARLVVVKPGRAPKGKHVAKTESSSPRVQLVLQLREDVTPTHSLSERPSGALLEITLPAAGSPSSSKS